MDNNMNQPNSQGTGMSRMEMSPEDAKASMGIATALSEKMMMSQGAQSGPQQAPQQGPQAPQNDPGQEEMQEPMQDPGMKEEGDLGAKIDELKKDIIEIKEALESSGDKEIEDLKKEIQNVLNQDDNENDQES